MEHESATIVAGISLACCMIIILSWALIKVLRTFAATLITNICIADAIGNVMVIIPATAIAGWQCSLHAFVQAAAALAVLLWGLAIAFTLHSATASDYVYVPGDNVRLTRKYHAAIWPSAALLASAPWIAGAIIGTDAYGPEGGWCTLLPRNPAWMAVGFVCVWVILLVQICFMVSAARRIARMGRRMKRASVMVDASALSGGESSTRYPIASAAANHIRRSLTRAPPPPPQPLTFARAAAAAEAAAARARLTRIRTLALILVTYPLLQIAAWASATVVRIMTVVGHKDPPPMTEFLALASGVRGILSLAAYAASPTVRREWARAARRLVNVCRGRGGGGDGGGSVAAKSVRRSSAMADRRRGSGAASAGLGGSSNVSGSNRRSQQQWHFRGAHLMESTVDGGDTQDVAVVAATPPEPGTPGGGGAAVSVALSPAAALWRPVSAGADSPGAGSASGTACSAGVESKQQDDKELEGGAAPVAQPGAAAPVAAAAAAAAEAGAAALAPLLNLVPPADVLLSLARLPIPRPHANGGSAGSGGSANGTHVAREEA